MFKKLILTVVFSVASISWTSYSFAGACAGNGSTQSNPNGVDAGQYSQQYELAEFEQLAGCEMQFNETFITHFVGKKINQPKTDWFSLNPNKPNKETSKD